jgi:hypothetical protein
MHVRGSLLVATVLALSLPHAAQACLCALSTIIEPPDGATDVPTNAKIWYAPSTELRPGTSFRLQGPAGEVPLDQQAIPPSLDGRKGSVFTPRTPLTPGAGYNFVVCAVSGRCETTLSFTVGSHRLDSAALPKERSRSSFYVPGLAETGYCASRRTQLINFTFDWEGIALLADVDGDNAFSPAALEDLFEHTTFKHGNNFDLRDVSPMISVGNSYCVNGPYANRSISPTPRVRFGVLDIAGNFSGWTPAEQVTLPTAPDIDGGAPDAGSEGDAPEATPDVSAPPDLSAPPPALAQTGASCTTGGRGELPAPALVLAVALLIRRTRPRHPPVTPT